MSTIRRIWITKVLKLSIAPIETAPALGTPARSQNRTSMASRAAELGTASEMNCTPYWSISTGQKRISCIVAPIDENAWGTWESGESTRATSSHDQSASWNSSMIVSMPMLAKAEISV